MRSGEEAERDLVAFFVLADNTYQEKGKDGRPFTHYRGRIGGELRKAPRELRGAHIGLERSQRGSARWAESMV